MWRQDCPSEQVILRDINQTFPAHDYFKEAWGVGPDALHKISKAYAVYDKVGYSQGLLSSCCPTIAYLYV